MKNGTPYDVAIIGGGPAGATSARELARRGWHVVVLERAPHPRFHIGESFLPRNFQAIRDLGLLDALRRLPHTVKLGAEFVMGHGLEGSTDFSFADALGAVEHEAFNIERAPFDAMLLDEARKAGAEVRDNVKVSGIGRLGDGDCALLVEGGEVAARWILDASGQATVIGRHLGTRRVLPHLRKIAYFGHFRGVFRRNDRYAGYPTIVMCHEGWFWLIPIDEERMSIGLVLDEAFSRRVGVPPTQMLRLGIAACPEMRRRCENAVFPESNIVAADFSYTCRPYAGPGYFLVGDAATFVDPIFSTGVCLGMMGAEKVAREIDGVLRGKRNARAARREYIRYVTRSSSALFSLVAMYYDHSFRELFLQGKGPLNIHGAVIELLAGNVFPAPRAAVRWRVALLRWLMRLQSRVAIAPRRERFLLESALGTRGGAEPPVADRTKNTEAARTGAAA